MAGQLTGLLRDGFVAGSRGLLEEARNSATQGVDGHTEKLVRTSGRIQNGNITSLKTFVERKVDPFKLQVIREGGAKVDYGSVIRDGLKPIENVIGHIEPGKPSRLNGIVSSFFSDVNKLLTDPNNTSLKQLAVVSCGNLCATLSSTAKTCYSAKQSAQMQLTEEIERLNSNIKNLHEVNIKIHESFSLGNDVSSLEDERDRLVREISSSISLETPSLGHDKTVMLRSQGRIILYKNNYAAFSYDTPSDLEALEDGADLGAIKYHAMSEEPHEAAISLRTEDWYNSAKGSKLLVDGKIKGFVDLHDVAIPKYIASLDALGINLTEQLNKVHNSGSPYPGRDAILGSKIVEGSDTNIWTGSAKISVVGTDGKPLITGTDRYKIASALSLDLESLSKASENGAASVRDIINEINGHFGPNVSPSCGMGQQAGAGADKKFLLADLRMVAQNSPDNQFVFDFEALNTSDFGSKIEILDAAINGNPGNTYMGSLPDMASLEKGQKARTYQSIRFNTTGLAGAQNIDIKVRVIGSNGQIHEGTIRYNVNLDAFPNYGARISGANAGGGGANNFAATNIDYTPVMEASLVDIDGNIITDDITQGYISIKSLDGEYKIIMQDDTSSTSATLEGLDAGVSRGLSHYFGLNNLINSSSKAGKYALDMSVRSDIASDPELFSSARLTQGRNDLTFKIGDSKASRTINGLGGAGLPANGDTININGTVYTFGAAPGNIAVPGNINALVTSLNTKPELKHLVTFSAAGNDLIITAANSGSGGNDITIAYNIAALGGPVGPLNLEDGTDQDIKASDVGLSVTSGDKSLYNDMYKMEQIGMPYLKYGSISFLRGTISAYATIITNSMSAVNEANSSSLQIEEVALRSAREEYDRVFGFDKDASIQRMHELYQLQRSLGAAWGTYNQVQDILFKAIGF